MMGKELNAINFADVLHDMILESGETRKDLAKVSGVNENTLYWWEHNIHMPRFDILCNLLEVLGYRLEVVKND